MPEVRVRRAGEGDVPEVVGLSAALFREDAGQRDPSMNLDWPAEEGRGYFAGLEAVGYLAGRLRDADTLRPVGVAELESMYVREGSRDSGVGARLVEEFLGWARERGAERASVTAYAANERAIRFYERLGFAARSLSLERKIG